MPRYHFTLVDGNIVSDHGTHELDDETMAQIEAFSFRDPSRIFGKELRSSRHR